MGFPQKDNLETLRSIERPVLDNQSMQPTSPNERSDVTDVERHGLNSPLRFQGEIRSSSLVLMHTRAQQSIITAEYDA